MLAWILENISTIIICALLLVIVLSVVAGLIRNRKKGKSSCGCGCSGCPMSELCNDTKHNRKQ